MITPTWQLQSPISAIIFDCDGTLTAIEGIDELAKNNGTSHTVKSLTAEAMGKSGLNPALYEKRLALVQPTKSQLIDLGQQYCTHVVPDAQNIIRVLKRLNKAIYLVSAGLYPAVAMLGEWLEVSSKNIFAVDIQFDSSGNFLSYDKFSSLIHCNGKREIVSRIKTLHPDIVYVGDGLNDYAVYDLVTRFVGYGGVFYRENIQALCEYYIKTSSLAPLLPLLLTQEEYQSLTPEEYKIYQKGMKEINNTF